MPHSALKLIPGVDTTKTPALNEAAISQANLIRFVPDRTLGGLVQKLGGWTRFIPTPLDSTILSMHSWSDTNGILRLAAGTKNNIYSGNPTIGMTPIHPEVYYAGTITDFSTVTGTNLVTVKDIGSNSSSTDVINLITQISVGGIILYGYYGIIPISADQYQILSTDILGNPVNATSTVNNVGTTPEYTTTIDSININVNFPNNGRSVGDTFSAAVSTTIGGITVFGNYIIQNIVDSNNFTISVLTPAQSTQTLKLNSGRTKFQYFIGQKSIASTGFGSGGFGLGGFGGASGASAGRSVATTSATSVGTIATITFSSPNLTINNGTIITVSGVVPVGYNGSWTVISKTLTSVSFIIPAALGVQTTAGTLKFDKFAFSGTTDWSIDNWGEDLISSPDKGPIYSLSESAGNDHFMILPNSPFTNEGFFTAMPQRQLIAYGSSFNDIQDPLLVRWCDVGNNKTWIANAVNQAGSYRIARGSKIVGAIQGPQQILIWTDIGVHTMQYVGPPYVYAFNEIGIGCGLIAKKAAGTLAGVVYWMGQSQFYKTAGGWPEIIHCPIWDTVFQNLSLADISRIRCAPNSRFGEITWYYPTSGSNGEPTNYVKYNTIINQWDYGTLTRTAWIDQGVFGSPIGAGPSNYIYQHETSNDADGQMMSSYFRTGLFTLSEGEYKTFIDQIWPDMKWGKSGDPKIASLQITFYSYDFPEDTPIKYGPFPMLRTTQYITPRIRGRLVSVEIESTDIGSFWRLGNIRYRGQQDGKY